MGKKLTVGDTIFDFNYQTPWQKNLRFRDTTSGHPVCLMFLRYYGCSTCQLELRELTRQYPRLKRMGVKLLVVLQSQPETLRDSTPQGLFPFDIICDPDRELYFRLDIGDNPSPEIMSEHLKQRVAQARQQGIVHGLFEGNEAQAPATFLLDTHGVARYVWYGAESADVPTGEELVELIKHTFHLEEGNLFMKNELSTANAPAAIGPYSQAIDAGTMIFVSGQLPVNPASGEMPDGAAEQALQSLANIRAILEQAGLEMEHIVKTTVFLKDLDDFPTVNEVYGRFFGAGVYPARACVQVAKLPKDALVEIEAIAMKP